MSEAVLPLGLGKNKASVELEGRLQAHGVQGGLEASQSSEVNVAAILVAIGGSQVNGPHDPQAKSLEGSHGLAWGA